MASITDENKIKFLKYELREQVTSTYECSKIVDHLPPSLKLSYTPKNNPIETKNKPKLLINIYDVKKPNPKANYTKTITHTKLKNALFIYLSNDGNSGYAGGGGGGTAMIGTYEHTFGIITGILHDTSNLEYGGFQNLEETNTFKLCHRADNKTYSVTPRQAIDYLLSQLSELIQNHNYDYIILPCDLVPSTKADDYHKYVLGAGLFNAHPSVKQYIYDKICEMTQATSGGWQLITDFLK
jgi:hypothetical protein